MKSVKLKSVITKVISISMVILAITSIASGDLPDPGMEITPDNTALVITDPQNDFLSPDGAAWGVVGASVQANNTVENLDRLFAATKQGGIRVFISPHYYFPTDLGDNGFKFGGALEEVMHNIHMFERTGQLDLEGFEGSGSDWLEQYKKYIQDGETVVTSCHKIYGPETNDLVLQLRKRGIDKVILGGMSANLCTESHMRELIEQGFEVAVVADATAAAQVPEGDGYAAALTNFRFIANTVWTTDQAVENIAKAYEIELSDDSSGYLRDVDKRHSEVAFSERVNPVGEPAGDDIDNFNFTSIPAPGVILLGVIGVGLGIINRLRRRKTL